MASPGTTHLRQDFLSRPSLELFSSGSLTGSIPEGFVLQQQQVDDGGIALPLGAPPEPGVLQASDALAAAAAAGSGLTQPLLVDADAVLLPLLPAKEEPPDAAEEARRLLKLALPLALQSLAAMLLTFISTLFVGHLNDPLALSAVVLSSSLYNVSGLSITIGLASAMDTLCGQAYGAQNYALLGVLLQRARLICWTVSAPICVLWVFMEPVLLLLGQDAALSRLAATNMRLLIPGFILGVYNDTMRRYLVSQRAVFPTSCCYVVTTCLSPLFNWLFIFRLGLRVEGAAIALVCCTATNTLLLSAYQLYRDYVLLRGSPQATWHGWSWGALRGWRPYLALGMPAAAMICCEWWLWEFLIILAGLLPTGSTAVGVMGLCIQITNPSYMVPSSFGSATAVRVANLLGAGRAMAARTAARVSTVIVLGCTLALGLLTFLGRHWIVRMFTADATIQAATAVVVPAVATSIVGDGMVAVLSSVLRASGRQAIGAAFNLGGYWGLCLPLAWLLGFRAQLGVLGFWCALTISTALQAVAFGVLISRIAWHKEVQRARVLSAAHHH